MYSIDILRINLRYTLYTGCPKKADVISEFTHVHCSNLSGLALLMLQSSAKTDVVN